MTVASDTPPRGRHSRLAITGVGAVTALGRDARTTFDRLVLGERGFRPITLFDVSTTRCKIAAAVSEYQTLLAEMPSSQVWSRVEVFAAHAAKEALRRAGIDPKVSPVGLVMGTTTSWIHEAGQIRASEVDDVHLALGRHLIQHPQGDSAERIASMLGGAIRVTTVSSACSSGAMAIVAGATWLELGLVDRVLVGAADALCLLTWAGFEAISALSTEPCRPFDVHRSGMSLGEGAGFLMLEREAEARARGAEVIAFLSGWAVGSEAHHATLPEPSAETAIRLLGSAMESAGLSPADVDYINAHGTGTLANDTTEAHAIRASLGANCDRTWVSSCKGQLGHTLAAAGAIEAVVCAMSLDRGTIAPTVGLVDPDPAEPLRHLRERGIAYPIRAVLSSSFGFGGNGVVLALEHRARPAIRREPEIHRDRPVFVVSSRVWHSNAVRSTHGDCARAEPGSSGAVHPRDALSLLDPTRSRRFDSRSALICASADQLLRNTGLAPEQTGLALGFSYGPVERMSQFLERIIPPASRKAAPAEFPHIVPSAAAGNASVYLGLKGPTFVVADARLTSEASLQLAMNLVQAGAVAAMIVGTASVDDPLISVARASLGENPTLGRADAASPASAVVALASEPRGKATTAELVNVGAFSDRALAAAAVKPPRGSGTAAIILHYKWNDASAWALRDTGWTEVRRIQLESDGGVDEVSGLLALDASLGLIEQGTADEVLVWTERNGHVGIQQLRACIRRGE